MMFRAIILWIPFEQEAFRGLFSIRIGQYKSSSEWSLKVYVKWANCLFVQLLRSCLSISSKPLESPWVELHLSEFSAKLGCFAMSWAQIHHYYSNSEILSNQSKGDPSGWQKYLMDLWGWSGKSYHPIYRYDICDTDDDWETGKSSCWQPALQSSWQMGALGFT